MREDLLEVLREPTTHAKLQLSVTRHEGDQIEEGTLRSEKTDKVYPIVRGIPRFVPESGYADSFGMQWNRFRETQLDSLNGTQLSTNRFWGETEWTPKDIENKWILDMGCGSGRFAEVAAAAGARIVALDLSTAVEATRQTLSPFPNAHVVQASLLDPPFAEGGFDGAYCIGVLQHTPDPRAGCRQVVRMVKQGGRFSMTIYARRPWTKLYGKYLLRPVTKRVDGPTLLAGIERAMTVLFPLTDKLFPLPVIGKVARFAIPVANYVGDPSYEDDKLRYDFAVLDTFDMLAPAFDDPMSAEEVDEVLGTLGARRWEFKTRVPINVIGER
ncbi:MAG: methyltransferase domain-containing protein [Polyangiaceae bacterium]|nr:methyltransferase domain-containing protein [Polyangiaceae bacterium]